MLFVSRENKGEVIGYGYVDKQVDPTDIALNGNKGSGRAFYLYENCAFRRNYITIELKVLTLVHL